MLGGRGDPMENLKFLDSVKKMPIMALPVRSPVVTLKNNTILISPGSTLTSEQLRGLGNITDIVAPNLLHCAGMKLATTIFPNAKVWGVEGAQQAKPDIKWTHILTTQAWPYQDELALIPIEGMPAINEAVFVHKSTRTLIVTDFCFNLVNAKGLGAWIILNLFGTYRQFGVSKFFARYVKDRTAFEKSVKNLFTYDFEKIVVGHGEIVQEKAKEKLLAALAKRDFNLN